MTRTSTTQEAAREHRAALGLPPNATPDQVTARIQELTTAAAPAPTAQHVAAREEVIAQAVHAQKIAADRTEEYRRLYDAQPVAIHNLLTAPVAEGGLMAGMNVGGDPFPEQPTDYPREWLGQQARPGGTVTGDGGGGGVSFEDRTTSLEATASTLPAPPSPASGRELPGSGGRITLGND